FQSKYENLTVNGFYDGDCIYKVLFMPSYEEDYSFTVSGTFSDTTYSGSFTVTAPEKGNHGPVRVSDKFHFSYEDGTPYYCVGTTCYVWQLQSDELVSTTLETLKKSPFNKIRFCIFPKHYDYNLGEPRSYPYEGTPMDSSVLTKENFMEYTGKTEGNRWDFFCFNPEYFRHIERCITELMNCGIEADLILMHPYDRWGFSKMTAEQDEFYLRYVTARFSAFRNVWWALANEYDILSNKSVDDWERFAEIIMECDPYNHLRSIHNCMGFYDHTRPWITHCSIQRQDLYKSSEFVNEWREKYQKPIVLDEIAYEGNIQHGWGNITAQELVRRFWEAACRGGYGGHGETYICEENVLWWSHGGILRGESGDRIAFMKKIIEQIPSQRLNPKYSSWDDVCGESADGSCCIYYYSFMRPSFREYYFDDTTEYSVEVIDTWDMTVTNMGSFKGRFSVPLPSKQYMAVKITKISE
ncbi:MAG: DUF5605 domain-containing protein, partial [Oscillospiraceae bacterium]|nr:DUF5605 domain-containing protein [Oscillospiraceae bacterium]